MTRDRMKGWRDGDRAALGLLLALAGLVVVAAGFAAAAALAWSLVVPISSVATLVAAVTGAALWFPLAEAWPRARQWSDPPLLLMLAAEAGWFGAIYVLGALVGTGVSFLGITGLLFGAGAGLLWLAARKAAQRWRAERDLLSAALDALVLPPGWDRSAPNWDDASREWRIWARRVDRESRELKEHVTAEGRTELDAVAALATKLGEHLRRPEWRRADRSAAAWTRHDRADPRIDYDPGRGAPRERADASDRLS